MGKTLLLTILSVSLLTLLRCDNPSTTEVDPDTVTDIDGNVYNTIKIGNQLWTVENLLVTHYIDGEEIPNITDSIEWANDNSGAYCYYDNDESNKEKYGALYNWYAVNTDKLAPDGWHVPDSADWDILKNYLIANGYNWDGTTSGNKIGKSMATKTDWDSSDDEGEVGNNLSTNNSSGFSALPGGYRDWNGFFDDRRLCGFWWSATEDDASFANSRSIYCWHDYFYDNKSLKEFGFSVRCVKD